MKGVVYKKGFTLIELMVVVLLIGLLSAIVTATIWSQREKAKVSSVLTSMKSAQNIAIFCSNENSDLNNPVAGTPGQTLICPGNVGVWPMLTSGWRYTAPVQPDVSTGNFLFTASNTVGDKVITCDINGCSTSEMVAPPTPPGP